ncbi:30S ribosome-binding factor RbfA [Cryomorphaceae bacterium 1068]|nr:30S ribosome-binding factor RbfA [Cryomorphaceae bacterium 1068]
MPSIRQEKVAKLIQQELAIIFQQHSRDLFGGAFITVTVVRMSPDLGFAKTFLSFFAPGKESKEEILEIVRAKSSKIRGILGNKVGKQLRIVPELAFFIDDSLDYSEKIDDLLKE